MFSFIFCICLSFSWLIGHFCIYPMLDKVVNNFKDTFNVDKKYLDYFVKNNFNYDEIKIFSYSKLDDVKLIRNF